MKIFRNAEVKGYVLATLIFLAAWSIFCAWAASAFVVKRILAAAPEAYGVLQRGEPAVAGLLAGGLAALGGLCLLGIWISFTGRRYRRLEQLSSDLDRLLHGGREVNLEQYREGELSILMNQVQKLLLRLTEQADVLKREKVYLSDSLADISHQLKTPLTSLHLILLRLRDTQDEQERRRLACEGAGLLDRLDWLVNALLKISRIDAGTAVFGSDRVVARDLAREALSPLLIPMELREQTIVQEIQEGAGFLGDFAWSAEALGNILKNCMEHTKAGGTIWLKAQENHLYTEFVIEDNGSGIDPEDLPHLFERFYKGKDSSDSSVGIGLALSRMIVNAQNGTLKAENRKEGGARFVLRFYKGVV